MCADFLFTRKGDGELAGVTDIEGLYRVLGDRKEEMVISGENEGLLADPSNKARKYLDVLTDEQQKYRITELCLMYPISPRRRWRSSGN